MIRRDVRVKSLYGYIRYPPLLKCMPTFGSSVSKRTGDGKWCPRCRLQGRYTWLDFAGRIDGKEYYWKCHIHSA